jgi:hypothetical protein
LLLLKKQTDDALSTEDRVATIGRSDSSSLFSIHGPVRLNLSAILPLVKEYYFSLIINQYQCQHQPNFSEPNRELP